MRAVVYHGPGPKAWEEVPNPAIIDDTDAIVRVDAVTICGTDLHILKGDVPAVTDGRILGHEAVGTVESVGAGVKNVAGRRPGARLVHHRLRRLPLLPRGPLRPVPRRRRLDPRPQDRRHPGRVRPGAVRRHLDLPGPGRRDRRGDPDAGRHPAHRLRGRRAQRPGAARRRRRRRRRRPDRAVRHHGRPAVTARPTSWPSTSPTAASRRPSSSAPTSRSTTAARMPLADRPRPHRRPRRRRRHRGGRRARHLRARHPAGPARRPHRQHRRPRPAGHAAPRGAVDPQRHHHDRPGRHLLDPDAAAPGRRATRSTPPGSSPTTSPSTSSTRPTTCSPTPPTPAP